MTGIGIFFRGIGFPRKSHLWFNINHSPLHSSVIYTFFALKAVYGSLDMLISELQILHENLRKPEFSLFLLPVYSHQPRNSTELSRFQGRIFVAQDFTWKKIANPWENLQPRQNWTIFTKIQSNSFRIIWGALAECRKRDVLQRISYLLRTSAKI